MEGFHDLMLNIGGLVRFQGGAFDPWGPHAAGYTRCRELTGSAFESVFFLNNLAANAKMISYYVRVLSLFI